MRRAILFFVCIFSIPCLAHSSDNFDYSYADAWIVAGSVTALNPERPYVYYRSMEGIQDAGVGSSGVAKAMNYPDTSTVFWPGFEGVSGAYARSTVNDNPYDRTLHSYTSTYQRGEGPTQFYAGDNWQGNPVVYSYTGPFGESKTGGYFANTFHIEPGTSGLAAGDPVKVVFKGELEGTVGGNSAGYTQVYFGSQVFNIADPKNFDFPDADRASLWTSAHNRGETLEMYNGETWMGLDPALAFDNGNSWGADAGAGSIYDSTGDKVLDAKIGDWLFVEGYFETLTQLPTSAGAATDLKNIADFDNTMHFSITPGEGFGDISLSARSVTPEPVSSFLFLLGGGALAARRIKKRRPAR